MMDNADRDRKENRTSVRDLERYSVGPIKGKRNWWGRREGERKDFKKGGGPENAKEGWRNSPERFRMGQV
jgi:hypothetical protein